MATPEDQGLLPRTVQMNTPTSWQAGGSDDPIWEEILAAFNEEHQAKYGMPMNRPWGSDQDAQNTYNALMAQYKTKWEAANPQTQGGPGAQPLSPPTDDDGGGGGGNQYWGGYEANVASLLGNFKSPIQDDVLALAKSQIEYAGRRLTEIEEARKLTDMTGTLTSDEKKMFQEMEDSAVANLKSQVNAQTQDVWNTALADLVNRGVLQGTVGQKILGTISSENVRTIAEGTNAIRGQTNANMLQVQEGNKNRALQYQGMLTQESMGLLGLGQGYANADLQAELQKLGIGVNANLTFAGLSSTEGMSEENRALQLAIAQLTAGTNMAIAQGGWASNQKIAGLYAATQTNLANMYSSAANQGSLYGLYGNLGAAGLGYLSKNGGGWWDDFTKWLNTDGGGGGNQNWVDPTDYSGGAGNWTYYG